MKIAILAALCTVLCGWAGAEPEVYLPVRQDQSAPLRSIPPFPRHAGVLRFVPNGDVPMSWAEDAPVTGQVDPVVQTWHAPLAVPSTIRNFEGISANGYMPPDTNGDVGPNHYVQMVNREFAVYSKAGARLYGPVNINTLWSGFGGICQNNNQGDPIVVYDQLADRWLLTQFAYNDPSTFVECIALSVSGDPTGSYYRYAFAFPNFNDYPKFGVWPDGYYATYILRNFDWSVDTGRICAYDRSSMLSGGPASAQCFDTGAANIGLLPADLDGMTPPPAGSPHYSMNLTSNRLNLWRLRIDWNTPGASQLTGPVGIGVASYSRACGASRVCIPQAGDSQKLDSFSDRLMFRLSYRNLGGYESLVTNHSVAAGGGATGIRWYEVRSPNVSPVLFQQGTYSPDANHRWMGSIATDQSGNMGLGFNISGSALSPGIRYTGRLVTDSKGAMSQGEGIIQTGGGPQTGSDRWGDYSALTVDPTDDCTFWYTTEYIPSRGTGNWRTRIASFKFPSCGCSAPSGISRPSAVDQDPSADTGVLISWQDPANWGDSGSGQRSYDVYRDRVKIAIELPEGTSSFVDNTGVNGQTYKYKIRYRNGCGKRAKSKAATAADM